MPVETGQLFRTMVTRSTFAILGCLLTISPTKSYALSEEELHLALLLKVAQFTTWPAYEKDNFRFCLYPGKSYDKLITENSKPTKIGDLKVSFILLKEGVPSERIHQCKMLLITHRSAIETKQILRKAAFAPILTASTLEGFANIGGMLELEKLKGRYRFKINLTPVKASNLKISASLLEISEVIRGSK